MRRFRVVRFLAVVLALGLGPEMKGPSGALRSEPAPGKGARAAAGNAYAVDVKTSRVYVKVEPEGRGHSHGITGRLASGTVVLGASEKAGELVFDMTSFDADAPEARKVVGLEGDVSDSDRHSITQTMLGAKVLDSQEHPKATYMLTSATPLDGQAAGAPGRYRLDGRFTLRRVERPLRFEAKAERAKAEGALKLRGQFTIKQTDYKIKPYSAFFGVVKVKDELVISGDLLLVPKAAR